MTLPTSLPLSLGQVYTEFGAPAGTPLGSFLRGGAYVPNVSQNNNVPTALPISLGQLLGATKSVPLAASVSPTTVSGNVQSASKNPSVTSGAATVSASGGTGSYSYSWTFVSGNSFTINSPTSASTTFTAQVGTVASGTKYTISGVYQCTVTSGGSSVSAGNVTVNLSATWT